VLKVPALQVRLELLLHVSRQRSAGRFAGRDQLRVMPLDELIQQRRLGAVPQVPRRIDKQWSTQALGPLARHGLASLRWLDAATLRLCAHRR